MSSPIVTLSDYRPGRGAWSQTEIAEFYRIGHLMGRLGWKLDIETGASDEGEPWLIFCDRASGEVVSHFARIDDGYVLDGAGLDAPLTGRSFRALLEQYVDKIAHVPSASAISARAATTLAHPLASAVVLVAAMCAAADVVPTGDSDPHVSLAELLADGAWRLREEVARLEADPAQGRSASLDFAGAAPRTELSLTSSAAAIGAIAASVLAAVVAADGASAEATRETSALNLSTGSGAAGCGDGMSGGDARSTMSLSDDAGVTGARVEAERLVSLKVADAVAAEMSVAVVGADAAFATVSASLGIAPAGPAEAHAVGVDASAEPMLKAGLDKPGRGRADTRGNAAPESAAVKNDVAGDTKSATAATDPVHVEAAASALTTTALSTAASGIRTESSIDAILHKVFGITATWHDLIELMAPPPSSASTGSLASPLPPAPVSLTGGAETVPSTTTAVTAPAAGEPPPSPSPTEPVQVTSGPVDGIDAALATVAAAPSANLAAASSTTSTGAEPGPATILTLSAIDASDAGSEHEPPGGYRVEVRDGAHQFDGADVVEALKGFLKAAGDCDVFTDQSQYYFVDRDALGAAGAIMETVHLANGLVVNFVGVANVFDRMAIELAHG
jgi:hypothetical protein